MFNADRTLSLLKKSFSHFQHADNPVVLDDIFFRQIPCEAPK
jgi:hypothetical protein